MTKNLEKQTMENIVRLKTQDLAKFRELNEVFAKAFNDHEAYASKKPSDAYLQKLLTKDHVIAMVAEIEGHIVGGLIAYVLEKCEQERGEAYIYDLAVDEGFRRRGIARRLIEALKPVAKSEGAWIIFVQADQIDQPAVNLYDSMGNREEPFHYDIPIE